MNKLCSSYNRSAAQNQDGLLYSTHENNFVLDSTVTFLYLLASLADETYDSDRISFAAVYRSPFLRCSVYNKPKVQFVYSANQIRRKTQ